MDTTTSPSGGQPAPGWEWVSPASMVLIAIAMTLALAIIWWGMRQRRRRARADAQQETALQSHAVAQPAPIETVIAEAAEAMPAMPPIAPTPPPLTEETVPVVATPPIAAPPPAVAQPTATADRDELGRMKGVGPKLAARLAELGYTRFEQIAALTPAEADALDAQLGSFRGRLYRDQWIEQATYLAKDDRVGFEAAFGRL